MPDHRMLQKDENTESQIWNDTSLANIKSQNNEIKNHQENIEIFETLGKHTGRLCS